MTIVSVFREADRECYGRSLQYLLLTGLTSISPLLLTAVAFPLFGLALHFGNFIEHGEAGIVTIGVLLWVGVLIARELKPPFAHRAYFLYGAFALWAVAVIVYASVRISPEVGCALNITALAIVSVVLWVVALLFGALVVLVDAVREKFDPTVVRAQQFDELTAQFEESKDE